MDALGLLLCTYCMATATQTVKLRQALEVELPSIEFDDDVIAKLSSVVNKVDVPGLSRPRAHKGLRWAHIRA